MVRDITIMIGAYRRSMQHERKVGSFTDTINRTLSETPTFELAGVMVADERGAVWLEVKNLSRDSDRRAKHGGRSWVRNQT